MNVFTIGGSRNIGYYASVRLLKRGATVTFLLRRTEVFDADEVIQEYLAKGKVRLVKGDALNKDQVQQGWAVAGKREGADGSSSEGGVDVLLFTVGGVPSFHPLRGFVINPPDLCSRSALNALSTIPPEHPYPRIVAVTSVGLTPAAHASMPFALRSMYTLLLRPPHKDKRGAERVLAHCMGTEGPKEAILPPGWEQTAGLPPKGVLANKVVVVRPALLTDGECRAEGSKGGYRVRSDDDLAVTGGYNVSRQDVAHFIAERVLGEEWATWAGKGVSLAY